jgi:hypothetical protein
MCKKFSKALDEGYIIIGNNEYFIRGEPDIREDGEITFVIGDHEKLYDDLTPEMKITHCPFCGEKLRGEGE